MRQQQCSHFIKFFRNILLMNISSAKVYQFLFLWNAYTNEKLVFLFVERLYQLPFRWKKYIYFFFLDAYTDELIVRKSVFIFYLIC